MNPQGAAAFGLEGVEGVGIPTGDASCAVSRRVIVGGLALGAMLLGGCGARRATSRLPDPKWPGGAAAPVVAAQPTWTATPEPAPVRAVGMPEILPRSSWTRAGVARPAEIYPMGGVGRITVHHDGMPVKSLRSTADVAARIEQIRSSHVYGKGWADIGYHYVIDPSGRVWEGRSVGKQGAHVKDQNEHNMGILVLGNFEVQRPSNAALSSLDRMIASQMGRYRVSLSKVRTHRELAQTDCPGRFLQSYMLETRASNGALAMAVRSGSARG